MNTKVEEAMMARCEAAFVAIETAANATQYDNRGGHGAELLRPLRDARTIIVELNAHIAQQDATIARMTAGLAAVSALIGDSDGVAGLHRNGDLAPWSELRTGGRFEEWLLDFDAALNQGEVK